MALTHSLIHWSTFLLWGLMTADDHSQTICLHSSLSTVNAFSSIYLLPVHSFMSFNHDSPGCPWWRVPAMLPSSTVNVIWPVLLLAMWPNYCSFNLVTLIIRYQSVSVKLFQYWFCSSCVQHFPPTSNASNSKCFNSIRCLYHPIIGATVKDCPHHGLHNLDFRCSADISIFPNFVSSVAFCDAIVSVLLFLWYNLPLLSCVYRNFFRIDHSCYGYENGKFQQKIC